MKRILQPQEIDAPLPDKDDDWKWCPDDEQLNLLNHYAYETERIRGSS